MDDLEKWTLDLPALWFWFPFYLHTVSPYTFSLCLFSSCLRRNCAGQHKKIHLDESELKKKAKEHLINWKWFAVDSKNKPEFTAATDTYFPIHNINLWVITYSTAIDKFLFFSSYFPNVCYCFPSFYTCFGKCGK